MPSSTNRHKANAPATDLHVELSYAGQLRTRLAGAPMPVPREGIMLFLVSSSCDQQRSNRYQPTFAQLAHVSIMFQLS